MDVAVGAEQGENREHGEESYLADQLSAAVSFFGVADAFGKVSRGVAAAPQALDLMRDFLRRKARSGALNSQRVSLSFLGQTVVAALAYANSCLFARSGSNEDYVAGGISIASLLISGRDAFVTHLGDARVYLYRRGQLKLLTQDDAVGFEPITATATAVVAGPPPRSLLWRTLGTQAKLEVSITHVELLPSDRFLLCTSGVHRLVANEDIANALLGQDLAADALGTLLLSSQLRDSTDGAAAIVVFDPLTPLREGVCAAPQPRSRRRVLLVCLAIVAACALLYVLRGAHLTL